MVSTDSESAVTPILHNPDWTPIDRMDRPRLYTCGLVGPLRLRTQVVPDKSPVCRYRVTLHFCELRDEDSTTAIDSAVSTEFMSSLSFRIQDYLIATVVRPA